MIAWNTSTQTAEAGAKVHSYSAWEYWQAQPGEDHICNAIMNVGLGGRGGQCMAFIVDCPRVPIPMTPPEYCSDMLVRVTYPEAPTPGKTVIENPFFEEETSSPDSETKKVIENPFY